MSPRRLGPANRNTAALKRGQGRAVDACAATTSGVLIRLGRRARVCTYAVALVSAAVAGIGGRRATSGPDVVQAAGRLSVPATHGHAPCQASIPASALPSGYDSLYPESIQRAGKVIYGGNSIDYPQMRIAFTATWYPTSARARSQMDLDLTAVGRSEVPANQIKTLRGVGDAALLWVAAPPNISLGLYQYDTHVLVRQGHRYANIRPSVTEAVTGRNLCEHCPEVFHHSGARRHGATTLVDVGSVTVTVVPAPTALSMVMVPRCCATIACAPDKPMPLPAIPRAVEAR